MRMLNPEDLDPELRRITRAEDISSRELGTTRIMGHHPELAKARLQYMAAFKACSALPPRLSELVRLRAAFHNQCKSCMAVRYAEAIDDGLTEDMVCSLEKPQEAPNLSPAERLALRYADLFANNHLAIDKKLHTELHQYFSELEIVELGMLCATLVGFGRLNATWEMTDDLPERFRATDGPVTPWGGDSWVDDRAKRKNDAAA